MWKEKSINSVSKKVIASVWRKSGIGTGFVALLNGAFRQVFLHFCSSLTNVSSCTHVCFDFDVGHHDFHGRRHLLRIWRKIYYGGWRPSLCRLVQPSLKLLLLILVRQWESTVKIQRDLRTKCNRIVLCGYFVANRFYSIDKLIVGVSSALVGFMIYSLLLFLVYYVSFYVRISVRRAHTHFPYNNTGTDLPACLLACLQSLALFLLLLAF